MSTIVICLEYCKGLNNNLSETVTDIVGWCNDSDNYSVYDIEDFKWLYMYKAYKIYCHTEYDFMVFKLKFGNDVVYTTEIVDDDANQQIKDL